MRPFAWIALFAMMIGAPVLAATVTVEYDQEHGLSKYKTFKYRVPEDHQSGEPLTDERIVKAIEGMLTRAGLKKVNTQPDLFATYNIQNEEKSSATTEQDETMGTVLLVLWNAKKEAVWRGTVQRTLKTDPDQRIHQVQRALSQMLAEWQKMRASED